MKPSGTSGGTLLVAHFEHAVTGTVIYPPYIEITGSTGAPRYYSYPNSSDHVGIPDHKCIEYLHPDQIWLRPDPRIIRAYAQLFGC